MKRLVLVGGGHAHLQVLKMLRTTHLKGVEIVLVTPRRLQIYSGMLPGWIAGLYSLAHCQIDLDALTQVSGVELILDTVVGMDARRRCVALTDGTHLEYDYLSLDIGSETDVSWLEAAGEHLLPVRPLEGFVSGWGTLLEDAAARSSYRLAIIGAGAAGVELAFAARYAFQQRNLNATVDLISSDQHFLAGHAENVAHLARNLLAQRGIILHGARAAGAEEGIQLANGELLSADRIIAATGSRAPCWLRLSHLDLDHDGYVCVDAAHRSLSHPDVFAAGDICARPDHPLARSGIHALGAGAVVAHNLLALLASRPLKTYQPRHKRLYLLATGPRHAIASWGAWSAQGQWVWVWKDWLDRRFIRRHTLGSPSAYRSSSERKGDTP